MASRKRGSRRAAIALAFVATVASLGGTPARAVSLGAPTLLSPLLGDAISGNPTLRWTAVPGASTYRVQVSTSSSFSSYEYNVTTYNTSATPPTDLPLGTLYWRVAAQASSVLGTYAEGSFEKTWADSPTLVTPADTAVLEYPTDPPTFVWEPLIGSKIYQLQIDDASDFVGATTYTTNSTSYVLVEPQTLEPQVWYWRVRGVSSNTSVSSAWSASRSYTIRWNGAPTLLAPPNTTATSIEDVNLRWTPVNGAKTYQVQVSPNGDWANNVSIDVQVKGTRYSPPATLNNASYFWRVRALDPATPSGNGGPWSEEWQFTRGWADTIAPLTPVDGSLNVRTPTFSWTPVDHASHYQLQVGLDANFSPDSYDDCYTNSTTLTPYETTVSTGPTPPGACVLDAMQHGQTYYWRVRGVDHPTNVNGLWSPTSSFVYSSQVVEQLEPENGASVWRPVLRWSPADGAERYRVVIKKANGTQVVDTTTYATSYTPTVELVPAEGPFKWYVRAIDHAGKEGVAPASVDQPTFSIVAPPTTQAEPTPISPSDASTTVRPPSLQWEPVTGAAKYSVFWGVAGSEVVTLLAANLPYTAVTYTQNIPSNGTYFWYVEAFAADGSFISHSFASGRTFSIVDTAQPEYVSPADCEPLVACDPEPQTPTLRWNAVQDAGFYYVYLALDPNFTNIVKTYETQYTSLTPRESLLDNQAGQAYYWFVRPCKKTGACGPFNSSVYPNAFAFQKRSAPVTPLSPADGATVADLVTFTWEDYLTTNAALTPPGTQEARQYRIQVSTRADFASILDTATVDQTTYTPYAITYPEGPLYWRVQAIDRSGNFLTFSPVRSLTKTSPAVSLLEPTHGSTVSGLPALSWSPQPYAARYQVQVYKNGDTSYSSVNKVFDQQTKMTAWTPGSPVPAGLYAWRVRRLDADGREGPWSEADGRTFTLQPSAPTLLEPESSATATSHDLLFAWTPVARAVKYRFESSTSSLFTSVSAQDTVMSTWAPTSAYNDGTYYWRVKVLDASNNVVATSAVRSFLKDGSSPRVISKAPTSSASVVGNFTVHFSEPVTGLSTSTFTMRVAGTSVSVAGRVSPSSSTATTSAIFDPTPVLVPGQSYTLTLGPGIVDAAGNSLATTSWTVRTALTVDNQSLAFTEAWDRDTNTYASGGAYDGASVRSARSVLRFTGTSVQLLGRRAPDGGYADVYLNGAKVTSSPISFYSRAVEWKKLMWSRSGLAAGTHTVEVHVLGSKPSASSASWVYVDAFVVDGVTYQENHWNVRDVFRRVWTSAASGGTYDTVPHLATSDTGTRPYARVTFKGTGVDVYAVRAPNAGRALIYIDGAYRGTVDLYRTSNSIGKVYASPTLTNGVHTVVVYVAGTKHSSSRGTEVGFDRFVVR